MDIPPQRPVWLGVAASAVAAFLVTTFQLRYPPVSADTFVLLVPSAIALILGLRVGWRCVPAIGAGAVAAAWSAGFAATELVAVAVVTTLQTAGTVAARGFLGKSTGQTVRLFRLLPAAAAFALVRGVLTAAAVVFQNRPDGLTAGVTAAALEWAVTALILPLAVDRQTFLRRWTKNQLVEFACILIITAGFARFLLSASTPVWFNIPFPVGATFLTLFSWAGVRFYLPGSLAVVGTVFGVLVTTAVVRGGFAPDLPLTSPLPAQLELLTGVGVLVSVMHLLAAIAGDRQTSRSEIARLHDELQAKHDALLCRAQEAADKNTFLEAVLTQLPAGVMIVGPDGAILQRNERHRRMFETESAARLIELPQGRMSTSGSLRLPYDRWPIVRAIRNGDVTEGASVRMDLASGASGDYLLSASPVHAPNGRLLGAVSVLTDVSERNQVVRQLRESEQKLRVALQSSHMIVVEWHQADGRFTDPAALAEWLRLPAGGQVETVTDLFTLVHPDDTPGLREKVSALMAGERQCETVFRVYGPGGGTVWVLSRSLALTDDAGKPTGMVTSVLVDVTDRYRQLDQLRLLESAVVHARDAVIILEDKPQSGSGRSVLYVNRAFTELSGYEPHEVVGRSLHLLRGPKSDPATLDRLRDALDARHPFQCELLNYRKDGTEFWVELSVVPVPDPAGSCSHWVMIQRDVSDRKRADAELRTSREGLAEAQRIAHLGSWDSDAVTGALHWSDEKFRIFGYEPDEITPTLSLYMNAIHPDDFRRVEELFRQHKVQPPLTPQQIDLRIVRPNGEVRHISEQYLAVCDDSGRVVRFSGVTQDITERRHAQEQLIQAQKMELIGQMAGGIAHDFNNVLTGLIGNLDLVDLPPGDPNRRLIATAIQAAFRATDMTRKLLGFARKSQLRSCPVSFGPIVGEVIDLVGRTTDPRIRVRSVVQTAAKVDGDATLLSQVLLNLCLNSRDALPHGGVIEVRVDEVTADDPSVRSAGRTGRFVRVSVEDDGIGIPPEVKEHMFEPFFTTKPVGEGTGLGLPMVHGIIEQHRGWVECSSEVGRGTRFDLYLPQCPSPAAESNDTPLPAPPWHEPAQTPPPADDRPKTVLLVDDEELIRDLARTVLESGGYRVLEACDGEQAIDAYRAAADDIDLVVLDLTMPRLSGQDTFRALIGIDPDARVLFSSGYSAETLTDIDGAVGLLPKPYRPTDLLDAVALALDHPAVAT